MVTVTSAWLCQWIQRHLCSHTTTTPHRSSYTLMSLLTTLYIIWDGLLSQSQHNCNVNFFHSPRSDGWNSQSLLPTRSSKFWERKGLRKVLILLNSTLYVYLTLLDAHIHHKTRCASGRKKWEIYHVICQCQSRIVDLRPKIREIFRLASRGVSGGLNCST